MAEILSVITGCMFSGKTLELQLMVKKAEIADIPAQVFKPEIDTRWGKTRQIVSHNGNEHPAIPIPVQKPRLIFENLEPKTKLVAIDEVQFFAPEIVETVKKLLWENIRVIVAGLPLDFRAEPFGSMPTLLTLADNIIQLKAICTFEENGKKCGKEATRTQRLINDQPANYNEPIILIGGKDSYAARCHSHHIVPGKPKP